MPVKEAFREASVTLTPEDELRAQLYHFLARFLASPPGKSDLVSVAKMDGYYIELGKAFRAFSLFPARTDVEKVDQEYHDLSLSIPGYYLLLNFYHIAHKSKY